MNGTLEHRGGISPDDRKMLVQVVLAPSGWWEMGNSPDEISCHRVQALVDTGAGVSGVTRTSIEKLGLFPSDEKIWVTSADQETEKPLYKVDVGVMLPTGESLKRFHSISVTETYESKRLQVYEGKTEMLLGMDIILHGALQVEDMRFCLGFGPQPRRSVRL